MGKSILYLGGFEMPDKNAAALRVLSNANLLREMGYKVSFIGISKNIKSTPKIVNGFKSCSVPYPNGIFAWIYHIFIFIKFSKILSYKPDYVVLYNFPAIASFRILIKCHKSGIKVVHDITEWESNNRWTPTDIMRKIDIKLRMEYCIKRMDGVIAISRYLYDYYSNYTNTILVPPTVDINDIKFKRNRRLIANHPIRLVYAGNIGRGNKEKLDYIVNCVSKMNSMKLTIVGFTLQQYKKIYGEPLEDLCNIEFRGFVPHQDAIKIILSSDFHMIIRENSLKNMAGFPSKLVESMSCCTPVIATNFSNICDYITNGKNGFIVNESNTLLDILRHISQMTDYEIIKMKEQCRDFDKFDYRYYRNEFSKIF